MLEAHYTDNLWKMLVACVLLNRTRRKQVDAVIDDLFKKWPTPESMSAATKDHIAHAIRSLGFYNRRAHSLVELSKRYVEHHPHSVDAVASLPGIGRFALEAYKIFWLNDLSFEPTDKELKKYVEFKNTGAATPLASSRGGHGAIRDGRHCRSASIPTQKETAA